MLSAFLVMTNATGCEAANINYDCNELSFSCSTTLTNLTIQIQVSKIVSATYSAMDNSLWSGVLAQSHVDTGSVIIYTWAINGSQTVHCPNSYKVHSWFALYGTAQPNHTDSYSITSVDTNGILTTISGIF